VDEDTHTAFEVASLADTPYTAVLSQLSPGVQSVPICAPAKRPALSCIAGAKLLYHFDQVFTHLEKNCQKKYQKNQINQKKNILGE
jgi:hypothetical protein